MYLLILLQGLDPRLSGYEAALALYDREAGPKPEKVCHLFFFEHVVLMECWIKTWKNGEKIFMFLSILGHSFMHFDLMF